MLSSKTLTFWLLGALTWLLLLGSPTSAAPTGITHLEDIPTVHPLTDITLLVSRADKDELPKSKADLKTKYYKSGPKKDKSCFFTGMDVDNSHTPAQNTAEAKKQCKAAKLTTLEMIWNKNNILNQGEWKKPISAEDWTKFLDWVSEIFAEETTGAAFLLLPDNVKPRKESIFFSKEFKAMKDSGKVDKIMNVKFEDGTTPTLPDITKDDRVWWKKGAADPPTRDASAPTPAPAPAPAPAAVTLQCFGTGNSKYINREGIIKVINTFCDEAAKQGTLDKDSGSIARTYNKDTPEQVDIAMDYKPGLNWRPMKDKCVEQMIITTDGCDTNSNHWKGGGSRKDTDVTYHWAPSKSRSVPVEQAKVWGGCDGTTGGSYTIWGAHWAADDFGSELLNNLKGKGISPTQWKFNYGGGDDHREWTAKFQTIIHAWPQVESSMESVGGWGLDIGCHIH
jgi:hypothetical protein